MARLALALVLLYARALADEGCAADGTCQADDAETSALLQSSAVRKVEVAQHASMSRSPMHVHVMSDKGLSGMGAVCLDGSDAAFYLAPASDPKNANDWHIHFAGGGWCYNEIDCWGRSNITALGTTKSLQRTLPALSFDSKGGLMGDDCTSNPDFCNFNRVLIVYCDGNSFSGNRDEPLVVTGLDGKAKPLYFRGKRIIDATLQTLLTLGLDKADTVLLSGCSAGGLATYLHADYVYNWFLSAKVPLKKFRAAPVSGFFLLHNNVENKPVYPEEMKYIFNLANSTHGLNNACISEQADEDKWKCNFAELAYQYTQARTFPLNSALDSWQTLCIYTAELRPGFPKQNVTSNDPWDCGTVPGWGSCANNPETCNADQMTVMNQYIIDFQTTIASTDTYSKIGNGAFIHSCHTHCEAFTGQWNTITSNGLTMQQAFSKWWNSESEPAAAHTYRSCLYNTDSSPHECDPSCGAVPHALV
jgi:hypothetical protein